MDNKNGKTWIYHCCFQTCGQNLDFFDSNRTKYAMQIEQFLYILQKKTYRFTNNKSTTINLIFIYGLVFSYNAQMHSNMIE